MSLTTVWVDLTPDELADKARALADAVRELALLDEEHKERRKEMAKDRAAHMAKLHELAYVVRVGKEERPVGVTR
jgi:hypothetical protein